MKMLKTIKRLVGGQPLPKFKYCAGPGDALLEERRAPCTVKVKYSEVKVVLVGAHFSTDLGQYVYWTVPHDIAEDGALAGPYPIAENYLESFQ